MLALLAAAAAAVSWQAQYVMVSQVKNTVVVAAIEAAIPDAGAVLFAALGVAMALHGRRALRPRALNAACVGISLAMNALAAGHGWRDLAVWVMPAGVYALASDTLIGVVRAWVLARVRNQGEVLADDGPTPLALAGGLVLWLLRLALAPASTLGGFRRWVVTDCPVAPGVRPGHLAELLAVRQAAEQHLALASAQRDEAVEEAAALARQARDEAAQAQGAEAAVRAEMDRVRQEADQAAGRAEADVARAREDLRGWSEQQVGGLRAEVQRVREDAARLLSEVRGSAAAGVTALEEARADLRARADRAQADADALRGERELLSRQLRAAAGRGGRDAGHSGPGARRPGAGPTKRDRMIQIAAQRRDLASVPVHEVSSLASAVAAEIGYSPGTAARADQACPRASVRCRGQCGGRAGRRSRCLGGAATRASQKSG